jgi:fatty acid desaturase
MRQYALFILGHDAIHGSLHPRPKVNDTIAKWLIHGPMFMGLEDGRRNHLEHHKRLGAADDPDRYLHVLENKSTPTEFLLFCSGLATFWRTVLKVSPFGRLSNNGRDSQAAKPVVGAVLLKYFMDRLPVLVDQCLLLATFWGLGLPLWSYFLIWVAPIYLFVFLPDEIRAFSEHAVLSGDEHASDDQRLITFRPNWLERAYFSPHNMNYHAEHHLWPRVPYYKLPEVFDGVKHRSEITVRGSYLHFLRQVVAFLKVRQVKQSGTAS